MTDLYRKALLAVEVCSGVCCQKGSMPSLSALEAERTDVHFLSNSGRGDSSLRPFPSFCRGVLAQAENFFKDLFVLAIVAVPLRRCWAND
mgnify:CR=1 FL=1